MGIAFLAGYSLSSNTRIDRVSNVRRSLSESGQLRFVDLGAQTYWQIAAAVEGLTDVQAQTLADWLVSNETEEIDLVIRGVTYSGYIGPRIRPEPNSQSPNVWSVRFTFSGIKQ